MSTPILATKLFIPPQRPKVVLRPRLIERLNEGLPQNKGLGHKLTLISAPAGFGKTTLVTEWIAGCERLEPKVRVAWLSLDEGDNDPARFLTYLVAALQTVAARQSPVANLGEGVLAKLQSPQPLSTESILTALINEINTVLENFVLVLDDYHLLDAKKVDEVLTFLLEHQPPQMHLVIATREDPHLPLARLRARGQLTELRAADLRFSPAEAAEFLNQVMNLDLSAEDIAALDKRTEGWIAGLQLAALALQGTLSMQRDQEAARFIQSFTGSHHFVLDYLMEEVLQQQPESIQAFLLCTSILDRMCGPLCDAVLLAPKVSGQETAGQETLEYLEHANLFIVPLDNERRWYRYHHLFADLLRQRLQQSITSSQDEGRGVAIYHIRASQWYEENGLGMEAFHHAATANDIERAQRLIAGGGMPLQSRGAVTAVLDWLGSLPTKVLDARPLLWAMSASLSLVIGQSAGVEEKLQAAEAALAANAATAAEASRTATEALQASEPDVRTRNLIGQIAATRATLALSQYQVETMIAQSHRALEYLPPENLAFRTTAIWTLGFAYFLLGDRAAAGRAYAEALSISQASGDTFFTILAASGLGEVREFENQLYLAAETYRRVLQMHGDHPQPNACEDHLGLARIYYQWNDLDTAEQHGQQGLQLSRQYDKGIDRFIICEVFLARLKLARGDVAGAAAILAEADQSVRQHNFVLRMPEVAAAQVIVLLHQGNIEAAAHLAQTHDLPISQARVLLAQGDPSAALAVLEPLRQQMEAKGWQDERLKVMVLQAVALQANDEKEKAVQVLGEALALAEPGGFIRLFVDEGDGMRLLISDFRLWIKEQPGNQGGQLSGYVDRLLSAFTHPDAIPKSKINNLKSTIIEPLSQRELEVLQLIAQGLSNQQISERLFLALDTVKGHNRRIFDKLQVQRRTEAVVRARELGLL